ncbi:MAG: tetratricopeptide repeat protein [Gammaproteobacteria bacterium]|nr:tetratricopeptide repeat protein [Gammaproteobacteria bacterium]
MNIVRTLCLAVLLIGGFEQAGAGPDELTPKTVIGPRNPNLAEGAQELLAGNAEEGIRLTRLGLDVAVGQRERNAGLGNMCAGYVMLSQYEQALEYCNQALVESDRNWRARSNRALIFIKMERYEDAEMDLIKGEEIAPRAKAIKEVRGIYMDATEPVTPNIVIDDRRSGGSKDES